MEEEIFLPRGTISHIAATELREIKVMKDALSTLLSNCSELAQMRSLIRQKIAISALTKHRQATECAWENFRGTIEYKVARKLFEKNKFATLREAIEFVL